MREKDILDSLKKLPQGLKKTYHAIMSRIDDQLPTRKAIAFRAFHWVMASRRPLRTPKLVAAVTQNPDGDSIIDVDQTIDAEYLRNVCRNLLVLDPTLDVWHFSHTSVK